MRLITAAAILLLATQAIAQPSDIDARDRAYLTGIKQALLPIAFLVGNWDSGEGKVAETGGTSKGGSVMTMESDGSAILRRDHTELFDKAGKPAGSFHQTMLIYPEGPTLKADYVDGEGHAIHYVSAAVTPGKSVTFISAAGQGPVFRLTYELQSADVLAITFGMTPPGANEFRPIATGTLKRAK
jgi:hypothetical protein